jgi:magnesium transporter
MTCIYELTRAGGLRPAGPGSGPDDGVGRWVRLVGTAPERLRDELHALALPDDVLAAWLGGETTDPLGSWGPALLLSLPVLALQGEGTAVLRAACSPDTLVTIEAEALPGIDAFVVSRRARPDAEATLPRLFAEVLEAAVSGSGRVYLAMRREADRLSDTVDQDPLGVPAETLLSLKRRATMLARLWDEQGHAFMEIQRRHDFFAPADHARSVLRDLVADADHGVKLLGHLDTRLRDLRQVQADRSHDSTNRRLNMLAILSAIYMPATLIAGIYGMNFKDIPIIELRYGYFIVMAIMLTVVLGQLWVFRRRGWFD